MFKSLFNSQAKTVSSAAGILAISALISRLLGFVRNWLLSREFGAGPDLDAYFAAFRVPDFIYSLLISGGIIVAFLPLFAEYFAKSEKEAWRLANNVLNIFLFFLVIFSLFLFIFAPQVVKFITPGFSGEILEKVIFLTRIMFLSPIFFGASAILSGVLQYFNRFFIYSLAPIFYNLGIILGILLLVPSLGVKGAALGVIIGAALHFLVQLPSALSCGFKYKGIFDFKESGVRKVFLLMLPRTFSVLGIQANLFVTTAIASTLSIGSITIFAFANDLQNIPTGVIGISFAMAIFPSLSRIWVNGEGKEEFAKNFSAVLRQIIFIIIPLSLLIFVLRNQIVEIVLKHGQFNQASAVLTAGTLGLFSFGILFFSLIPLISRAFFSFKDTKTPALVVLLTIILNITLSFYFTQALKSDGYLSSFIGTLLSLERLENMAVLGLPIAFSISAFFQFFLLAFFLYWRIGDFGLRKIFSSFWRVILAVFLMAWPLFFLVRQNFLGVFWQTVVTVVVGLLIYFAASFFLRSPELEQAKLKILNKFKKKDESN